MANPNQLMWGDCGMFANETRKLMNNKDMSDVHFVVGSSRRSIYAHKCLLSARCEVLKAMFAEQGAKVTEATGDVPFVLPDMSPEIFLAMLEYIYTNSVSLSSKNCVEVMACATEYVLEGLKQICTQFMLDTLCVEAACDYLQAAVTFKHEKLKTVAMDYIAKNTEEIFKTKAFHELSDTALSIILKSDDLEIDEMDLVAGVREWATINAVVLGKSVQHVAKKVIGHVRLPLLSPEELEKVDEMSKKDKLIPVDQLAMAWKCHALRKAESNDVPARRKGTKPRECHQGISSVEVLNFTLAQASSGDKYTTSNAESTINPFLSFPVCESPSVPEKCSGASHESRTVRRSPSAIEKSTWATYTSKKIDSQATQLPVLRSPSVTEKSTRTYYANAIDNFYSTPLPRRSPSATEKYAGALYSTRPIKSIMAQPATFRSPSALLL